MQETQDQAPSTQKSPIIIALDFPSANEALNFAKQVNPQQARVKVGKELFMSAGPSVVESLQKLGFEVFLDLKFHDIPNTVAQACVEAAKLGVWMTNVHAVGGQPMMEEVMNRLQSFNHRPLIIAVTILTSMNQTVFESLGYQGKIEEQVLRLARLTKDSGLDGVVCSAKEAPALRQAIGNDFALVTPGIRLADNHLKADDQQRVMTPTAAMAAASSHLVIGRPITQAAEPNQVLAQILAML